MNRGPIVAATLGFFLLVGVGVLIETRRQPAQDQDTVDPSPPVQGGPAAGAPAEPADPADPADDGPLPRIDTHMHIGPRSVDRAVALMDRWGISGAVNLSGMSPGPPNFALETQLKAAEQAGGRILVFMTPNFMRALRTRPKDYGKALAEDLERGKALGAAGVKISKALGLGYPTPDGKGVLPVNDPGLTPLWEKAAELGMPIAIHVGDPQAFWEKPGPENERHEELQAHPGWSLYREAVPSWRELFEQFEEVVTRNRDTTFIGVHFGNSPEEPEHVSRMLNRNPNYYIDTAARIPEIARHGAESMAEFFTYYQDRILFATDTGVGETQEEMMYGSTGAEPATEADEELFFTSSYRFFETRDRQFDNPTPIQGRWKIDGLGLPREVLRKVYFENAAKLLKWKPLAGASAGPAKTEAKTGTEPAKK